MFDMMKIVNCGRVLLRLRDSIGCGPTRGRHDWISLSVPRRYT
jgi:hypothetical protein